MDMRSALLPALLATLVFAVPASAATPRHLFVYGDSLAVGTEPFLTGDLPAWKVEQDVASARPARLAAAALRGQGDSLPPVVHLSLGTLDDPARPGRYRRAVRRAMAAVGRDRCVVWTNLYRLADEGEPRWERLNRVLDDEARARGNLIIVDWYSIMNAHRNWAGEGNGTHLSRRGYRARAQLVASAVRRCHERLDRTDAPAPAALPHNLFVYGDSMAVGTEDFLPGALPHWDVKQDVDVNRRAATAAKALRALGDDLAPVIHLSLGTGDDPAHPRRFRRAVRRAMRAAGRSRCVVWANVFRPAAPGQPPWARLNTVLAEEEVRRDNLVTVDWYSLVGAHTEWLDKHDATHVNEKGYRARARAVADGVRECHARLESGFSTNSRK